MFLGSGLVSVSERKNLLSQKKGSGWRTHFFILESQGEGSGTFFFVLYSVSVSQVSRKECLFSNVRGSVGNKNFLSYNFWLDVANEIFYLIILGSGLATKLGLAKLFYLRLLRSGLADQVFWVQGQSQFPNNFFIVESLVMVCDQYFYFSD